MDRRTFLAQTAGTLAATWTAAAAPRAKPAGAPTETQAVNGALESGVRVAAEVQKAEGA